MFNSNQTSPDISFMFHSCSCIYNFLLTPSKMFLNHVIRSSAFAHKGNNLDHHRKMQIDTQCQGNHIICTVGLICHIDKHIQGSAMC